MLPILHPKASRRRRARRASSGGFTLIEVLGVICLIGVLAALAGPGFVGMMRDRRTAQETAMFMDVFRNGRSRALGHGGAVEVAVTTSQGGGPFIVIREHISSLGAGNVANANSLPVPGCNSAGAWRVIESYASRGTSLRGFTHLDPTLTTPVDELRVCYTPRGRTLVNYVIGGGGGYVPLDGVVTLQTERSAAEGSTDGNVRTIFVLPNGLTRVSL